MENKPGYNKDAADKFGWFSPNDKYLSYFYEAPVEPKKAFAYGVGLIIISIFAAPNISFVYAVSVFVIFYFLSILLNSRVRNRHDKFGIVLKVISAIGFICSIGLIIGSSFGVFILGVTKIFLYFHIDESFVPAVLAIFLFITSIIIKFIRNKTKII